MVRVQREHESAVVHHCADLEAAAVPREPGHAEVGRSLRLRRAACSGQGADLHARVPFGERDDGGSEALVAEHGREDAVGERPEVVQRRADLVAGGARAGVEREPHQALLGTVVEIAFQPSAFGVARRDDPRARFAQAGQLSAEVGLQALVVDRQPRSALDLLHETCVVEQSGPVQHDGDDRTVARQRGLCPPRTPHGRVSLLIDPAPVLRGVDDLQTRVAECDREHAAQPARPRRGGELDDEAGEVRARAPRPDPFHGNTPADAGETGRLAEPQRAVRRVVGEEATIPGAQVRRGREREEAGDRDEHRRERSPPSGAAGDERPGDQH